MAYIDRGIKIVCAAIRHEDLIICGARHFDMVMHKTLESLANKPAWNLFEQGFIDQKGNFYNRREAWEIALLSRQVTKPEHSESKILFSEDLY